MGKLSLINYIKKDKSNGNGESGIYLKIKLDDTQTTLFTYQWVSTTRWKKSKMLSITRDAGEKTIKTELGKINQDILSIYTKLKNGGISITANLLKQHYQDPEQTVQRTFQSLIDLHTQIFLKKVESTQRSEESFNKYTTVKNHLKQFLLLKYKTNDLPLNSLNFEFVENFDLFLRIEKKCCNNTTVKYVQFLRAIINTGRKYDWIEKDPFIHYENKLQEVETKYLTANELKRIEAKDFGNERLNIVRDTFLFSCFTGFAPIDISKLNQNDLIKHVDGNIWIMKARKKTNVKAEVPLLPPALRIIERYKNHPKCKDSGLLVPYNTNSTLNAYLKEIGDICKIEFNLHFYVARHTFATTVTMLNGVSMESVSKMLGHKRIAQTQVYSKIVSTKIGNEMQKVFDVYQI